MMARCPRWRSEVKHNEWNEYVQVAAFLEKRGKIAALGSEWMPQTARLASYEVVATNSGTR